MVSDVRVWGDIDVNDVLAVGGGESSYPIMCSVKEGDVLPTGEYLEQTISVEDQLYQVRHYVKAWKDADGNPVTSYEAGKTYTPEYIDTKMLDVRVQYKKDTVNSTDTEEKVIARFIGSVDKLEGYKETGFILSTKERDLDFGKGYKECTGINTVYEGLYENVNGVSAYKSAEELYDTYSDYIFAYDIGNLPAGQKVYARAYVRLSDGTTVLGNVRKILVSGGNLEALRAKINGKTLSVLGDSISTYTGYSNDAANTNSTIGGNAICYDGSYILTDVNDTWWMSTVNETGMKLLVNNSWSGDKISLRGKERALQLHDDTGENAGTEPDIIAVYLGINDINGKSTLVDFRINYTEMISGMAEKYKNADVFLFTHVPNRGMGVSVSELEAYNAVIEEVADTYGCTVVDLYNESGMTLATCDRYTGDGLHPNAEGMELIMNVFIDALTEKYK